MAVYTNKAKWASGQNALRIGRQQYLDSDTSARPTSAKAKTTVRHYVRKGRDTYVTDVNGRRRS